MVECRAPTYLPANIIIKTPFYLFAVVGTDVFYVESIRIASIKHPIISYLPTIVFRRDKVLKSGICNR